MRPNLCATIPAFLLLAVASCGGAKKADVEKPALGGEGTTEPAAGQEPPLPAIPSSPAPLPPSVLAALSIGDPQGQLASVASFADAVQPGFGAMLSPNQLIQGAASAVGAPGLDGVDLTKPIHLLLLDPKKGGGQTLLVAAVADEKRLLASAGAGAVAQVHAGYAAIGTSAAIQAAAPYALSSLAGTAPPKHPHAVVYMNRIMESYGAEVDAQLRQAMGPDPKPDEKVVATGLVKALSSIERLEASLETAGGVATATLALFPQRGSALAAFAGLQKPSDYSMAARLPAGEWLVVAAGSIDGKPMEKFVTEMAAAQGKPEIAEWFALAGSEFAFALLAKEDRTLRAAGLAAITDGKKVTELFAAYMKKMATEAPPMESMELTAKPNAHRTGGVALHSMTIKPAAQTSAEDKKEFEKSFGKAGMKTYFGVSGDWVVFSLGKEADAKGLAGKVVQTSKAKAPKSALSPTFEKALADSAARHESGVMVVDLSAVFPDPAKAKGAEVTLGLAFDGQATRSRVTIPAATLRFLMQMRRP